MISMDEVRFFRPHNWERNRWVVHPSVVEAARRAAYYSDHLRLEISAQVTIGPGGVVLADDEGVQTEVGRLEDLVWIETIWEVDRLEWDFTRVLVFRHEINHVKEQAAKFEQVLLSQIEHLQAAAVANGQQKESDFPLTPLR